MEFNLGRSFTKQRKQLFQANDKRYEGMGIIYKKIRSSTEHRGHQANTQDHDGWKRYLSRGIKPVFAGYHIFAPAGHIERYMKDAIFRFNETKKDDLIMAATNLFGNIININSFEDGNGRICRLILAHVLMQMKCCLVPVILTFFHRRSRRHYIQAVKRYNENPSMLYMLFNALLMILKSLIHCWDNFEQNAKMMARC